MTIYSKTMLCPAVLDHTFMYACHSVIYCLDLVSLTTRACSVPFPTEGQEKDPHGAKLPHGRGFLGV